MELLLLRFCDRLGLDLERRVSFSANANFWESDSEEFWDKEHFTWQQQLVSFINDLVIHFFLDRHIPSIELL